MNDRDRLEALILERARRGYAPSPASRSRVQSATIAAVAGGASVPLPNETPIDLAASLGGLTLPRILVALVALGGAGAGGYALGLREGLQRTPVSPPNAPALAARVTREAAAAREIAPPTVAPTRAEPERSGSVTATPAPASAVAGPAPAATERELSTLRRVERVLRDGNPRLALALLAELDESAPRGSLMEERHAARAVATCQVGNASAAPAIARAFDARYRGSVYAARVREACAGSTAPGGERNGSPAETDANEERHTP